MPPTRPGTLPEMILNEAGFRFRREATHWRCVEYPDLVMLRAERYRIGDREFATLDAALRQV